MAREVGSNRTRPFFSLLMRNTALVLLAGVALLSTHARTTAGASSSPIASNCYLPAFNASSEASPRRLSPPCAQLSFAAKVNGSAGAAMIFLASRAIIPTYPLSTAYASSGTATKGYLVHATRVDGFWSAPLIERIGSAYALKLGNPPKLANKLGRASKAFSIWTLGQTQLTQDVKQLKGMQRTGQPLLVVH